MLTPDAVAAPALPPEPEHDASLRAGSHGFMVVGLGAADGGLASVARFFEAVPDDAHMAYVVTAPLPADQAHGVAERLRGATRLPVQEVADGTLLVPDHVYVTPPGRTLWMNGDRLYLRQDLRVGGRSAAVDTFFRVLAQVHRHRAVGVVLAGRGTDGSMGLKRIKELGGITFAQDPADAEAPAMPRAALDTGMVDMVMPAAQMPALLREVAANAGRLQLPGDVSPQMDARAPASPEGAQATEAALAEIMAMLRARTEHDFRHYKRPTILRRLERRMQVTMAPTLAAYRDHLAAHAEEMAPLLQDMLISVTRFFRDREAFDALAREALPGLQSPQAGEPALRAWVVGCAGGDEAYSLAMLLKEEGERRAKPLPFQIFATDINRPALQAARAGCYPDSIAADVSPARLGAYFVHEHDHYRVDKALRERILFAHHNVLHDPPFSHVDLILCRNLLIYLDGAAQTAVFERFRFALRPGGVLFLGSSESAPSGPGGFEPLDALHRIFRLAPGASVERPPPAEPARAVAPHPGPPGGEVPAEAHAGKRQALTHEHERAMLQCCPPSVLVDLNHRILHSSEGMSRWLRVPSGLPSQDLLDKAAAPLRPALRSALYRARPVAGEPARAVAVDSAMDGERVRITAQAVVGDDGAAHRQLVVFQPLGPLPPPAAPEGDAAASHSTAPLEAENRRLQQQLQDVVEHAEASTAELMSSNEELQSVNEELRSASEELETSREELQSINEELTTVNQQLALKIEEAARVNNDLQNLINANDIPTIFVDRRLCIQRYGPPATALFNLIPTDVGRSLLDITHRIDHPQLGDDIRAAFDTQQLVEREVRGAGGRCFMARVRPYRTADAQGGGAILSFIDVTALRDSEREVRAGAERLRLAAESTRDFAIITADDQGTITGWNLGAERLFGHAEAEALGQPLAMIFTEEDRAAGVPAQELARARADGRAEDERWHRRKDGSIFYCSGVVTLLHGAGGFSKIARDLTGSKRAELARERQLRREKASRRQAEATMEAKEMFLAVMSHELKHPLNLIHVNAELLWRMPQVRGEPVAAKAASIIRATVAGQARIVDDLLDLSRARTGKLRLDRAPVDWIAVVQRIVDGMRPEADAKAIRLAIDATAPALVSMFDPVRAEQVVWNLLSNAIKFTPHGGAVTLTLQRERDLALLQVADTGCGIEPENLDSVFEMFRQDSGTGRHPQAGLGIGLALVRELVVAHGGRVQAYSRGAGQGAAFSVRVPLYLGDKPAAGEGAAPSVLAGLKVIAIDDSEDAVESLSLLLQTTGAQVTTAHGASQALACMAREAFDVMISDISMPGMTGLELVRAVRARPGGERLIALAFSGYSRANDAQQAREAGFDALVPKPAGLHRIERIVQGVMAARAAAAPEDPAP